MARAVEHDIGAAVLSLWVDQVEPKGSRPFGAPRHGFAESHNNRTRQTGAAGHQQTDRSRSYDMGAVTEAHLAAADGPQSDGEGLDQGRSLQVERRRQRHEVVGRRSEELGRATPHIDTNKAEVFAYVRAASPTGPTRPARQERVYEHRRARLQVTSSVQ
jgi:hypothetical protein